MKVLAINTSPERERSAVSLLLEPFLDGLRESGAEAELYYACDLIMSTSPECDDIQWLRRKMGRADILVLASPLYFDGRTGPEGATPSLKMLLERLIPGTQTSTDMPYEHAAHIAREDVGLNKIVIVSGSGFWEIGGAGPVMSSVEKLCNDTFPGLAGDIAAGRGVTLRGAITRGMLDWEVIGRAREAGCRLAYEEEVPPTAHDRARREAVTRDVYGQIMNANAPRKAASQLVPVPVRCAQKED
ncbi:MAG: Iron-sulfur flavoprotein [Methanocella sp. PtaU1.Bin125]|nr:MAG: Iron-sulfur flavoprotein [Methanocella sp. PtaU1.Bin125]